MNGVIYTRVSSEDQVKGMSLEFQREDCITFAKDKNISVVKIFEERGESAKFADRPELLKIMDFCRKNKGTVDVLILWKIDRLSRNQMDYYFIKRTLLDYGVSILSATEPSLDGSASIAGKIFETFSALQAEIDNITRRERSVRGMEAKIASGIFPWEAPLGYRANSERISGGKKDKPDEPDPERFPLIQKIFRTIIDFRIHTSTELSKLANDWGLRTKTDKKVYPQLIDRMIENRFYAGQIFNPWTKEYVNGLHQPAISMEDFQRVQRIRNGEDTRTVKTRYVNNHPDFPLRRFVKCAHCGTSLTGSWSTGRVRKHAYYHCSKKGCIRYGKAIRKAVLEKGYLEILKRITPTKKALKIFRKAVVKVWREEQADLQVITRNRKRVSDKVEKHLKGLFIMKERDLLTDEEFMSRKQELNNELASVKVVESDARISKWDLENCLNYAEQFISNLARQWFDMGPNCRRRFQKAVFPEGISYDRETGFGTTKLGSIYRIIQQSDGSETSLVSLIGMSWNEILSDLRMFSSVAQEICGQN